MAAEGAAEPAAPARRRTVLFDFDGVVVRHDSFETYLRERLRRAPWRIVPALPLLPFVPLLLRSARGQRSMARLFLRLATAGSSEQGLRAHIDAFGRDFAQRPDSLLAQGVSALRAHIDAGDRVIVVSGCEHGLLQTILDTAGVGPVEALGSILRWSRYGASAAQHNVGRAKLERLAAHGVSPPFDLAYSDSLADLPMLAASARAIMVNPSRAHAERVAQELGERLSIVSWT